MNRYVRAATAALLMAGGLGSAGCAHKSGSDCGAAGGGPGCTDRMNNAYDTVWPERYNYAARQATLYPFAQQAANGHFLEQTIWNWYFEPGTDKLNGAGMEKLDSIARTAPSPDPRLHLQTARDVAVTAENADKIVALRDELTAKRATAVLKYLATQPGAPVAYDIDVHDAAAPGIAAPFAIQSYRGQRGGYVSGLGGGGGGSGAISGGGNLMSGSGAGAGATATGTGTTGGTATGTGPGY